MWVFVDNESLQIKLLEEVMAKLKPLYGDYKYLDGCYDRQETAKQKEIGIWSNGE